MSILLVWALISAGLSAVPDTKTSEPAIVLNLPDPGTDPAKIDYAALPQLAGTHAVVSPADATLKFQLHNYLIHHAGRFWCMWSQGPPVEDEPSQTIRYATSEDGLRWTPSKLLTPPPREGYAYIARGFWLRDGELLALAAHFKGKGAFGVDKELQLRAFAWNASSGSWQDKGLVFENAINNFPPQPLPGGEWMMTRRDSRFNVFVLIGGLGSFDAWQSYPVVARQAVKGFSPDEPIWWALSDERLVALYRDNGGSGRLFRSFSSDRGQTWSTPALTNFPNATSKIFSHQTSGGPRFLISNANPTVGRRQLHISLSDDGLTFTRMAQLAIPSDKPATLQYPHAIEQDGHLFVAYSRNKGAIELLKVSLKEISGLQP